MTEFAAIALALAKLGVQPVLGVPVAAIALTALVLTGSYRRWERIVIFLCLIDLAWFATAFRLHLSAGNILRDTMIPSIPGSGWNASWLFLVIAIVGTTIAPWQLFFQQSCVADKRLRFSDLPWARLDTFIGAVFTVLVAGCMMLAGNAVYERHWEFTDPAQMAVQLGAVFGPLFKNRSYLPARIASLSAADGRRARLSSVATRGRDPRLMPSSDREEAACDPFHGFSASAPLSPSCIRRNFRNTAQSPGSVPCPPECM